MRGPTRLIWPEQHVEQLRQFVEAERTQPSSDARHARVVLQLVVRRSVACASGCRASTSSPSTYIVLNLKASNGSAPRRARAGDTAPVRASRASQHRDGQQEGREHDQPRSRQRILQRRLHAASRRASAEPCRGAAAAASRSDGPDARGQEFVEPGRQAQVDARKVIDLLAHLEQLLALDGGDRDDDVLDAKARHDDRGHVPAGAEERNAGTSCRSAREELARTPISRTPEPRQSLSEAASAADFLVHPDDDGRAAAGGPAAAGCRPCAGRGTGWRRPPRTRAARPRSSHMRDTTKSGCGRTSMTITSIAAVVLALNARDDLVEAAESSAACRRGRRQRRRRSQSSGSTAARMG